MNKSSRNEVVDMIRGFAAIATLLSHAIQRGLYPASITENPIFAYIRPWYMTSFILCSGYILSRSVQRKRSFSIGKKAKHLVIPTFVWSIILWAISGWEFVGIKWYFNFEAYNLFQYVKMLMINPTYVIWFLWVIFVLTCITSLAWYLTNWIYKQKSENKNRVIVEVSLMILFLLTLSSIKWNAYMGIQSINYYYIYFVCGWAVGYINDKKVIHGLVLIVTSLCMMIKIAYYFGIVSYNVDSWLLIGIIYLISYYIVKFQENAIIKFVKNIVSWFGQNSLSIYLCQTTCLNIGIGTGWFRVFAIFVTATTISVIMTILIKKVKPLSIVLLGDF